jgi:aspartate aminotransferase
VWAFQGGEELDRYLRHSRRILAALGTKLGGMLAEAGVDVVSPQGAFYLFPDFRAKRATLRRRGIRTSEQLCERLLDKTGVAILSGASFGRPPRELTARLAYVNFDGAAALAAVRKVPEGRPLGDDFLRAHCGETLEAVERLCAWLPS